MCRLYYGYISILVSLFSPSRSLPLSLLPSLYTFMQMLLRSLLLRPISRGLPVGVGWLVVFCPICPCRHRWIAAAKPRNCNANINTHTHIHTTHTCTHTHCPHSTYTHTHIHTYMHKTTKQNMQTADALEPATHHNVLPPTSVLGWTCFCVRVCVCAGVYVVIEPI